MEKLSILILFFVIFWLIATYNGLVALRQHVRESWSGIDTELKRRHDLIPQIVETVKGYAIHEERVLQKVVEARQQAAATHDSPAAQAQDENILSGSLRQLFAVAENYPELKASANFLHLQTELTNTEDRIQATRRFYNANVRDLNTRIEQFPSVIVASMFSFKSAEFFELETPGDREMPTIKFS